MHRPGQLQTIWPEAWQIDAAGTYTASIDLSSAGLSGTGQWTFTIVNGWSIGGSSNYDLTMTLNGLCTSDDIDVPGCTDSGACNYNPNATVDDGSCDFEVADAPMRGLQLQSQRSRGRRFM